MYIEISNGQHPKMGLFPLVAALPNDSVPVWSCDSVTVCQCGLVTVWSCDSVPLPVTVCQCGLVTVCQCGLVIM